MNYPRPHDPHRPDPYQGPYQQPPANPYYGQQPPDPYYQQPPPDPYYQQRGHYPDDRRRPRRGEGADMAAHIVRVVVGVVATIFVLHIVFVVLDANQGNGFVALIYDLAQIFVLGLGDVFTPDDATIGVVINYAFAALLYLIIGHFVVKALRRD